MNSALFRMAIAMGSIFVASLIVAAAIVALGGFSYLALLNLMPAPAAALISILACLLASIVIVAGGRSLMERRHLPAASGNAQNVLDENAMLEVVAGLAGREAADLIRKYPQGSTLTALAAGFAVGAYPELRDLLQRFLAR